MAVELDLPFTGTWRIERGPGDRIPSHGTDRFGQTYAYDFVAVDEHGRTAPRHSWRRWLATEAVEGFVGFGRPILAPAASRVVVAHDGEPDGVARRSALARVPLAWSLRDRLRRGASAVAGNHVVMALDDAVFVLLAHLRRGSVCVRRGDVVAAGAMVGACGNSGTSTEPHLHLQAMDAADPFVARGLPVLFRDYDVVAGGPGAQRHVHHGVPSRREVVRRA